MAIEVLDQRVSTLFARWKADETASIRGICVVGGGDDKFDNKRTTALLSYVLNVHPTPAHILLGFSLSTESVLVIHGKGTEIKRPDATRSYEILCYDEDQQGCLTALDRFFAGAPEIGSVSAAERQVITTDSGFAQVMLGHLGPRLTDVGKSVGFLLAVKDEAELMKVRKAAALARAVLQKYMQPELVRLTEKGQWPSREEFSARSLQRLERPQMLPGLESMDATGYRPCLTPLVQSGGQYALEIVQSQQSDQPLSADCTVFAVSCCHEGYCGYAARTYLFPPKCGAETQARYSFALAVHDKVMTLLVPGANLSDVFNGAMTFAKETNADFAAQLDPNFGCGTGLTVLDGRLSITGKFSTVVENGMTFIVRVAMLPFPVASNPGVTISQGAILIADTVTIEGGQVKLCTKLGKQLTEISFEETVVEEVAEVPAAAEDQSSRPRTRRDSGIATGVEVVEQRKAKLIELFGEKHAAWLASGGKAGSRVVEEDITAFEAGRLSKGLLPELGGMHPALHLDVGLQAVWLPVGNQVVPFHLSTVLKAEVKPYGNQHLLVVTFHSTQESNVAYRANSGMVFIRELTIVYSDRGKLETVANRINEIVAAIKQKDTQRKQSHGAIAQGGLQLLRADFPKLGNVKCRPPLIAGKGGCTGTLEAHANGFRFTYVGGDPLTVLYANLKHVIFQPAGTEAYTIIHLVLKQPILYAGGKKKLEQVQWIAEVVNQSEAARGVKRTHEEELEADEREENRIKMTNFEFITFCKKLEPLLQTSGSALRVERGFQGFFFVANTGRSGQITFHGNMNAIWSLSELPFWCQSLDEVEVASLERIYPGSVTFDIKFVLKDYRKVVELSSAPMKSLDALKDYLIAAKIIYLESGSNLNWNAILKDIRDDAAWTPYSETGWRSYFDSDSEDEDEEEESEEDSDAGDDDDESDEESFDSSDAELVSEDSDVSSKSEKSSAPSWDEMERRAEEDDRRRGRGSDDSDSDAPRRKKPRTAPAKALARPAVPGAPKVPVPAAAAKIPFGAKRPPGQGPPAKIPPRR